VSSYELRKLSCHDAVGQLHELGSAKEQVTAGFNVKLNKL